MLIIEILFIFLGLFLSIPIALLIVFGPHMLIGTPGAVKQIKKYNLSSIAIVICLFALSQSDAKFFGLQGVFEHSMSYGVSEFFESLGTLFMVLLSAWLMFLGSGIIFLGVLLGLIFPSINHFSFFELLMELVKTAPLAGWLLAYSLGNWMFIGFGED